MSKIFDDQKQVEDVSKIDTDLDNAFKTENLEEVIINLSEVLLENEQEKEKNKRE